MADEIPTIVTTSEDEDWIKKVDGGKWQAQDIAASNVVRSQPATKKQKRDEERK